MVVEKVVEKGVSEPKIEPTTGREEEFQKGAQEEVTQEEHVPMKVVATPVEVGIDETKVGERDDIGLEQMDEDGVSKKVSEEKEAEAEADKEVIELDNDSEEEPPSRVFKQEAEEEEDQSTLVKRPRSERRTRPRERTSPLREATPPREDTPPMSEQSPQLEKRQMEEPKDESESGRERRRQERKRKGKLLAQLARKKVKTASPTVTIQETGQLSIGRNRRLLEDKDEKGNSEEERQRE